MKINDLCKKNPQLLEIQFGDDNENLGMIAARLKLEWFVLMSLDNDVASIQQNKYGWNIGMYCAWYMLEDATIKALKNEVARNQTNNNGETIESMARKKHLQNVSEFLDDDPINQSLNDLEKTLGLK